MFSVLQLLSLGLAFSNPKPQKQMGKSREGKFNTWWNEVRYRNVQTNWAWYKLMKSDNIFLWVLRYLVKVIMRSFLITFEKSCWSSVRKPSNFAYGTKLGGVVDRSDGWTVIQRDFDRLEKWTNRDLMKFQSSYHVLHRRGGIILWTHPGWGLVRWKAASHER